MTLPVLILAGGGSSRMQGVDKLLEPVGGQPLLARQIARAQPIGPVYVALPAPDHPRMKVVAETQATALISPSAGEGIGGTLRDAVAQLPVCDAFMILLPDLIDLDTSDLKLVAKARTAHPDHTVWRGATETGKPGHPMIVDNSLRPQFAQLDGDIGAQTLLSNQPTYLVPLPGDRARRDLDTPSDWAAWRAERGS